MADHFGVCRSFLEGGNKEWEAFIGANSVYSDWSSCRAHGTVHNGRSLKIWGSIMLDRDGFRPNVGIILLNQKNQVFWGKRIRTHSWQFPQGGIDRGETPNRPCSGNCTKR